MGMRLSSVAPSRLFFGLQSRAGQPKAVGRAARFSSPGRLVFRAFHSTDQEGMLHLPCGGSRKKRKKRIAGVVREVYFRDKSSREQDISLIFCWAETCGKLKSKISWQGATLDCDAAFASSSCLYHWARHVDTAIAAFANQRATVPGARPSGVSMRCKV